MTTSQVHPILVTFPNRRGLQEAMTRLLGPPPHCDHRDPDGKRFHSYPYEHVWIVVTGGMVHLRARSDLSSLTVSVRVADAEVISEALSTEFRTKASMLAGAVNALPFGGISLNYEEYVVGDKDCNPGPDYTIPFLRFTGVMGGTLTLPVEQPPHAAPLWQSCNLEKFSITAGTWRHLHRRVFSARGPGRANTKNEATHGVRVEIGSGVKMVATDGHRLHVDSFAFEFPFNAPEEDSMLLPSDFCEAVSRRLGYYSDDSAKLVIDYRQDTIVAQIDGDQVYRERTTGFVFPPYQELVDRIGPRSAATLQTVAIISYLDRLLTHRREVGVALLLRSKRLTCRSDWSTSVDFDAFGPSRTLDDGFNVQYDGSPREAKASAMYLLEAFRACGETATLSLGEDRLDPIVIASGKFMAVVMPTKCAATDPEFAEP